MEEIKPISPKKAKEVAINKIEPEMIQAFNEIIGENLKNGTSRFLQDEVEKRYLRIKNIKTPTAKNKEMRRVYDNDLMDVEDLYEKEGWDVDYDSPAYNESYDPSFTFTEKTKRR